MQKIVTEAQKAALEIVDNIFGADNLWLVGGWVRDALLGRVSDDIDLAASGTVVEVLELSRRFSNSCHQRLPDFKVSYFPLDTENGVARIVFSSAAEHFYLDIAALSQNSLEADLLRRDFTINALALPLGNFLASSTAEAVVDRVGGVADLQARLIRPVREANIIDDPLRMLRGVRLRAQLRQDSGAEWEFAPDTLEMFKKHAALINQSAGERVGVELNKTMLAGEVESSLRLLDSCGLLSRLIPELDEGKGNIQMPAHYYDVWNHNLVAVDRLEWLVFPGYNGDSIDQMVLAARPETIISFWPEMIKQLLAHGRERLLWLVWGTLLHDVGKPRARTVDPEGQIHFYEHQRIGAEMSRQILGRFHFSKQAIESVATMVQHHLRLGQLGEHYDPKSGGGVTNRAIYKFLRDTAPVQIEMMPLSLADHAAVVGPWIAQARQLRSWERHLHLTDKMAHKLLGDDDEKMVGKPRLIDGNGLMAALNLKPGPQLGKILREIEEAQAVGEISTLDEALTLAQRFLEGLRTEN